MTQLTLVILAAGMGSRYGGIKQLESFGPQGERLIDYSIADAAKAGFKRVVLVIRPELHESFLLLQQQWQQEFEVEIDFVYQELTNLPAGCHPGVERTKPWGTAHAVLCARKKVLTPFVVINADDYYGLDAYQMMSHHLSNTDHQTHHHAMVSYLLKNTLSPHGTVSRGVCHINDDGKLVSVVEYTKLSSHGKNVYNNGVLLPEIGLETPVSMNFWGFTPTIFPWLEKQFRIFLNQQHDVLQKSEYYIPLAIDQGIQKNEFSLDVLTCQSEWLGVTYREDVSWVKEQLALLADR